MPRRERPYLVLQQNQFRESYELHVNDFIRGSKVIQVSNYLLILFIGCMRYKGKDTEEIKAFGRKMHKAINVIVGEK